MPYEPLEEKRIYRHAEELADRVWDIVAPWDWFAKRTVGAQLVRACDSVGANIAEAGGRFHPADVRNFLYHSRGSLRETKYWLRRSLQRRLVAQADFDTLDSTLEQLSREINESIGYQNSRLVKEPSPVYSIAPESENTTPPPHHLTTPPPHHLTTDEGV